MEIHYDIMTEDPKGGQFLDSFLYSKREALRILREQRASFPDAYLVKVVRTRVREQIASSGKKARSA